MGSITAGILAFVVGTTLAVGTAVGVVQSQSSAGSDPVDTSNVSYGNR